MSLKSLFGLKPLVFIGLAIPSVWLIWNLFQAIQGLPNGLGANPVEFSNRFLGEWALRFLFLTLAIRPTSRLFKIPKLMLYRRMLGLFTFYMVCLHVLSFVVLDYNFDWNLIWQEVLKRNFITLGFLSFLGLIPLAVTSTKKMIKRIGAKRWQNLHRLIYPISILAMVHFDMMVRGNQLEPKIYAGILTALLVYRLWDYLKKRRILTDNI